MASNELNLSRNQLFVIITAFIVIILLLSIIMTYNSLVEKEENIDAKWSEIKNQDQRKVDLIPGIISVLEGYQEFEKSTLENITALRSGYQNATTDKERANISKGMSSMFTEIRITFEAYPDLHSIVAVTDVMDEMAGTENRITYARNQYIDAVREYNTEVRSFPGNMVAGTFGFETRENLFA